MENGHHISTTGRGNRTWLAVAAYATGGWIILRVLLAARAESGLPEALDTGFIGVFVAGFLATILLIKTRIAGAGPPILHAMRALAVALAFAAMGLLVAHWIELGGTAAHAHMLIQESGYQAGAGTVAVTYEDHATAQDDDRP
jgi:hypothetical protein